MGCDALKQGRPTPYSISVASLYLSSYPCYFKGIKLTSVLNRVPLESSFLLISGSDGKHILDKYLL